MLSHSPGAGSRVLNFIDQSQTFVLSGDGGQSEDGSKMRRKRELTGITTGRVRISFSINSLERLPRLVPGPGQTSSTTFRVLVNQHLHGSCAKPPLLTLKPVCYFLTSYSSARRKNVSSISKKSFVHTQHTHTQHTHTHV